ncbi:ribosome-recycling factor-like [Rattus rattus]|uniref:ribosome-recycling factor-like n=1 Tax=Rattus rattus TaxID=10117 RepID=UPI0013F2BED2|nr:ribosome-recycling factor-like [Rattus rattus]
MCFDWNEFEARFQEEFRKVTERLSNNFHRIYSSRIHPDLFDDVIVEAYGSEMKINEVANIQIPQARTVTIKPYDMSIVEDIHKAIKKYHPEFSPLVQADHIKIALNPPTEESRRKTVKEAKEYMESAKVSVRNIRKDFMDEIKKHKLPEDQEKKYMNSIDGDVKKMNVRLDEMFAAKEKELLTI